MTSNTGYSLRESSSEHPAGHLVRLSGRLTLENSELARAELFGILRNISEPRVLVLDLSGVSYISSTGVGTLVLIRSEAVQRGVRLYLRHTPEKLLELLNMLGFHPFFSFLAEEDEL